MDPFEEQNAEALFEDRYDAGRKLARFLTSYRDKDVVVLALPRGGVPVAWEVARALGAPMDVFLVRKLGMPGHEELAMGAIASGGVRVINREVVGGYDIPARVIDTVTMREQEELERRERDYRGDRPPLDPAGRTAIIVDDGLATGSTMRAAIAALRQMKPREIVVAVPVAARTSCDDLAFEVDRVVCAYAPERFYAVGSWYRNFSQTSDEEVRELLDRQAA